MAERRTTQQKKPTAKPKAKTGNRGAANRTKQPAVRPSRTRARRVGFMQKSARAAEIATMRAQDPPISWTAISKQVGLSVSACREAYGEWLRWRETESSPERVVDETVALMTGLISTLAVIADDAAAPDSARVGAARALLDTTQSRFGLLVRAGRVPLRLGADRGRMEIDEAWRQWIELLGRHGIPGEVVDEFAALRRRAVGEAQPVIEGTASV